MFFETLKNASLLRHAFRSAGRSDSDDIHIGAAAAWLIAAQQAGGGGYAHSFHVLHGWQPPYPETTGYIIPTLHRLYRRNGDPTLQASLVAAVAWLKSIQQYDGGFADLKGRAQAFDTGQILLGLNYLAEHAPKLADEAMLARAAHWLVSAQQADGSFVMHADNNAVRSYCVRVGAAMTGAGRLLNEDRLRRAGEANLRWTLAQQQANGFFRHLSLDRSPPFLHTMMYAIEGLLDGYTEVCDPSLLTAAMRFAEPLLAIARRRARILCSQYHEDFTEANSEKCLVGLAQWAGVCLRLADLKGQEHYREEGLKTIDFLKRRQIRCSDRRLDGGLWGSDPPWGRYMRLSIPNWGVKFFIDALLQSDVESNQPPRRLGSMGEDADTTARECSWHDPVG
jgi:hypothetical protein